MYHFYPKTLAVATIILSALAAFTPTSVNAQSGASRLEEVLVTATRTPINMADDIRPTSVLNKEDIEFVQAEDVLELLQVLPGVQFGRTGGRGGTVSLFLRGSNSNHLLVLIDGVRVSNANGGAAPWNEIRPESIERVEVVRGPRAMLYGSDAIGGVVHIFTKDYFNEESKDKHEYDVTLGYGSRNTVRSNVDLRFQNDNYNLDFNVSGYDTQGISHRDSGAINDDDSSRVRTAQVKFSRMLPGEDSEVGFHYLHTEGTHEYDDFTPLPGDPADVYQENRLEVAHAYYRHQHRDNWQSNVALGYTRNDSDTYDTPFGGGPPTLSEFGSRRTSLHWLNTVDGGITGTWLVGVERYRDEVEGSNNVASGGLDRDNNAVFAEWQHYGDLMQWTVSARQDDNDQHGTFDSYGIDWGINLGADIKFTASYGKAFHAPTYNDLYGFGGNPNLKVEEADNSEIAVRGNHDRYQWGVHVFENEIESLISVVCDPVTFANCLAVNINEARIRGVEFEFGVQWGQLRTDVSWTWLDPRNLEDDSILLRRARREGKVSLRYKINQWDLGLQVIDRGGRFDFGKTPLDPYTLLNLNARWQAHPQWQLQFKVDNALDDHYELASGYRTERLTGYVSVRWNLDRGS